MVSTNRHNSTLIRSRFRILTAFWGCGLLGCLLLGCGGTSATSTGGGDGAGGDKDSLTLMLNWYPEAEHGGYYAAQVHGIYEKYGLDVTIRPGGPTAPVAQELVSGRVEFVIGNADDVLVFREEDVPMVALLAPIQNTPRCILVRKESGVDSLSELSGLTLQAGIGRPYLTFMESKGLLEGVQVVPYSGVPAMASNDKGAMQAYSFSEPLLANQAGLDVNMLMVYEIGFNPYASCLVTSEDYIEEHEDIVQRMVQATREGWQRYFEDPASTNAAILEANEHGMTKEAMAFGTEQLKGLCITEETPVQEFGAMSQSRWETLIDQFAELKLLDPQKVSADKVYTSEFLEEPRE